MRRTIMALVAATLLCAPLTVAADEPSGTLQFDGLSAGFLVGFSGAGGVLTYQGYRYHFSDAGMNIADMGIQWGSTSADVYGLNKVEDFSGNYIGLDAGLAVAAGGAAAIAQNQQGVSVHFLTTSWGIRAALGAGALNMTISPAEIAAVRAEQAADKAAARAEDAARRAEAGANRTEVAVQKLETTIAQAEQQHYARRGGMRPSEMGGAAPSSSTSGTK